MTRGLSQQTVSLPALSNPEPGSPACEMAPCLQHCPPTCEMAIFEVPEPQGLARSRVPPGKKMGTDPSPFCLGHSSAIFRFHSQDAGRPFRSISFHRICRQACSVCPERLAKDGAVGGVAGRSGWRVEMKGLIGASLGDTIVCVVYVCVGVISRFVCVCGDLQSRSICPAGLSSLK